MRCTAVDLGQLQIATLALHASLNQTATTDLRVALLSAFLDAAANALPVLVAQRLGSQSSVPPVGEFIDLTTCRCAPSSAFANRQCRAVIAALNGPLKPG